MDKTGRTPFQEARSPECGGECGRQSNAVMVRITGSLIGETADRAVGLFHLLLSSSLQPALCRGAGW